MTDLLIELPSLQFFADEPTPTEEPTPNEDEKVEDKPEEKVFTQEQVESMIKSRVERAMKDKERELEESRKLAKMNAEEKAKYEREKIENENKELKAQLAKVGLVKEVRTMLDGINVSDETIDLLVTGDAESTKSNVETFKVDFNQAVETEIQKRLQGKTPKANAQVGENDIVATKESFASMTFQQKKELKETNPSLYYNLLNS